MVSISVVVPIYNVKEYLEECINSLIEQTINDVEIILVDDGSTDGSETLCDIYADKYDSVRVIHKANGGLGSARNVGLEAATGKFIYFIDGDDSIKKGALEKLYNYAEKELLDVILFSAECFSDGLGINYNANEYKKTQVLDEVLSGKDLFIRLVDANEYYASIPLRFYRTEYLQRKDYRFPEDIIHEDEIYAYWSLIQAGRALSISDRLYNRRFRAGSIMTSRKAYDSSVGYIYTWKHMMLSLQYLKDWNSDEVERAIKIANNRLGIAATLYAKFFSKAERNCISFELGEIKRIVNLIGLDLSKYKFINLFANNPKVYRFIIKIYGLKDGIRTWAKSEINKLFLYIKLFSLKFAHVTKKGCAVLIGTPSHGNLGDQAIVCAEKKLLQQIYAKRRIVEIESKNYLKYKSLIQRAILKNDKIVIDGGGSMGTLWVNNEYRFRDVVKSFPDNNIYIFPQTIHFGKEEWEQKVLAASKEIYNNHKYLNIFCRDAESYSFAKENFRCKRVIYTPDMVLSLYPQKFNVRRENRVMLCYREDIESICSNMIKREINIKLSSFSYDVVVSSTLTGGNISSFCRERELRKKWLEFASSRLVITDRLHAMIFCVLTGTPCLAIDNLSKKVSGTYSWVADIPFVKMIHCENDINEINIEELVSKADEFVELTQVNEKYRELRDIIKDG